MSMQLTNFTTSDGNNKAENQNCRDCCEKNFIKTFSGNFWPCLSQAKFEKLIGVFTFRAETRTLIAWGGGLYVYRIGCFGVQYSCIFLRVQQYFDEHAGQWHLY